MPFRVDFIYSFFEFSILYAFFLQYLLPYKFIFLSKHDVMATKGLDELYEGVRDVGGAICKQLGRVDKLKC
jgi:hypothetical protein